MTSPSGCPVFPGFELDHVAQEQFLPLVAQAALAASVETGSTVQDVKFCTGPPGNMIVITTVIY